MIEQGRSRERRWAEFCASIRMRSWPARPAGRRSNDCRPGSAAKAMTGGWTLAEALLGV
jgi:hypothetical protein